MTVERIGIVGAGLIGTSIGLALARTGRHCLVTDVDAARAGAAAALGAGVATPLEGFAGCDHVVIAVPPTAVMDVLRTVARLNSQATLSDVTSTKTQVLADVETLSPEMSTRFCGAHPIAGRERGGPGSAQPELFDGAAWAVCPSPATSAAAAADATALARLCGARVVTVDAALHDAVLATVSHAPQVVASVLAARLHAAAPVAVELAGPGFRDTTRLADSDPRLWSAIAAGNAGPLASELFAIADTLAATAWDLERGDIAGLVAVITAGREARMALPGKAATRRPQWARVGVVLADRPGELARLLGTAGSAGINVEDLAIEHAPDHPVGYVDLDVRPEAAEALVEVLRSQGWAAHRND